jgi:acyl-CoA synthetase (AMP-forming)/AMP-acid ligase II
MNAPVNPCPSCDGRTPPNPCPLECPFPFPAWAWQLPEHFNIGVACTDAHLGTANENKLAMIVEDDVLGVSTATYRQLAQATSRFAQLLRNLGVAAGDRVLIRLPNSLAYPTAFLGAMKRGAIAVPTSTLLTAEEVVYLARDSEATVLVTDKAMWQGLREKLGGLAHLRFVLLTGPGGLLPASGIEVRDLESELAEIVLRAATQDQIARSGLSGLHLRHHRLPERCAARAPGDDRARTGGAILVRLCRGWA